MATTHCRRYIGFVIFLSLVLLAPVLSAQAQDTSGNRLAAAYRYAKVAGIPKMMNNMINQMAMNYSVDKRKYFIEYMNTMDFARLENIIVLAMAQHFTVEEIESLEKFYGSPIGQSVMKKFPAYMATAMPSMQTMLIEHASNFPN